MQRKKSKTGKIILAVFGLFLVAGVAGTVATGALTDWTFNLNDPFNDVRIEDQEFDYDGEAKTLNIFVPDGASYELTITDEEGKTVNECKDIGVYTFTYKVKIDYVTKEYIAKLTIKDSSTIDSKIEAKGMRLNKARSYMEGASAVQEITYTVEPEGCEAQLQVLSIDFASDDSSTQDDDSWKNGKNASDYIACSIDEASKTIKITNKNSEPFGSQILVTVQSAINSDVSASITCDFKAKEFDISAFDEVFGGLNRGIKNFAIKYPYNGDVITNDFSDENRIINLNLFLTRPEETTLPKDMIVNTLPEKLEYMFNYDVGTIDCTIPRDGYSVYLEVDENINPEYVLIGGSEIQFNLIPNETFDFKSFIRNFNRFMDYSEASSEMMSIYLIRLLRDLNIYNNDEIINSDAFNKLVNLKCLENEYPLFRIPKEHIKVHIGDWLTVPYYDFFTADSDDEYLDFIIDLSPEIRNVTLEDTNVTF